MRLEETVQVLLDESPVFSERWECLVFMFCVIGNGFQWENGELVCEDTLARYDGKKHRVKDGDKAIQRCIVKPGYVSIFSEYIEPVEGYSAVYTYPEDINSDWMEGINEVKLFLETKGIIV